MTGWALTAPFALWLVLDKSAKLAVTAMDPSMLGMPRDMGTIDFLNWIGHYAWLRFIGAAVLAFIIQRIAFPRRLATVPILLALVWTGMTATMAWMMPGRRFGQVFAEWSINAWQQLLLYATCTWRELATASLAALVVGALFKISPGSLHKGLRWFVMVIVGALCILAGIDFAYESGTGQAPNAAVLLFSLSSWRDFMPLVLAEVTPVRVFAVVGGALLAIARFRWLGRPGQVMRESPHRERAAMIAAMVGSLALLAPTISTGIVPMERHSEGTFIALFRTTASPEASEAARQVQREFESAGEPPWHSIDMSLQATARTRPLNVVIVMLESVRAASTTIHEPSLPTTPFLARLAHDGLTVEDMSVVYPRTNGAWVSILSGQYPLTIEGVARWTVENGRQRRIRSLPSLLRAQGYATAFFTPTDLDFIDEIAVVRALEFEHIASEPELKGPGEQRTNYLGLADRSMIDPIMKWTAAQQSSGRPFMTAIMTNVGHHPYTTPASWKKVRFPGVTDEPLNDYYNCLLYIDGFLHDLMQGYEKLGLRDNTVFIVLGDHGQFFGEHGIRQVFNGLYEEGLHTPALIYAPGLPGIKGTVRGARQQIDVMPTVLDLLGYETRGGRLAGTSLLGPPDPDRKLFYSTSMEDSALATRQGSRKYIYYFDRSPMEAFDLATDPKESRPLELAPRELSRVKREMLEWKAASELSMYARPVTPPSPTARRWARR